MKFKPSLTYTLQQMEPNGTAKVPFDWFKPNTVRNAASVQGKLLDSTFSVHIDWKEKTCTITRSA